MNGYIHFIMHWWAHCLGNGDRERERERQRQRQRQRLVPLPGERGRSAGHCSSLSHTHHRCWASTAEPRWHTLPSTAPMESQPRNKTIKTLFCIQYSQYKCTACEWWSIETLAVLQVMREYLGVVELHGVICGQGHTEALVQKLSKRIFGIFQKEAVVAQWWHCDGYLGQVVQVLQHRALEVPQW